MKIRFVNAVYKVERFEDHFCAREACDLVGNRCKTNYINHFPADDSCYNETGEAYVGRRNVSKSGRPCRSWPSLDPPAHNYCRNPEGRAAKPWCYVGSESDYEVEFCDMKKCTTSGKPVKALCDAIFAILPVALFYEF